jgi:hypothetical protein
VHPAEHRALRELYAFTTQLARHWGALADKVDGEEAESLSAGAHAASQLLEELENVTAARDLYVEHAARIAGRVVSARPTVGDRLLERNQALRFAALDAQHVITLLAYLAVLGAGDGDEELRAFCGRWERKLRTHERAVRRAAVALGERPDDAIAPADDSLAGRAGAKVGYAFGTVGEWVDRQAASRRRAPSDS